MKKAPALPETITVFLVHIISLFFSTCPAIVDFFLAVRMSLHWEYYSQGEMAAGSSGKNKSTLLMLLARGNALLWHNVAVLVGPDFILHNAKQTLQAC